MPNLLFVTGAVYAFSRFLATERPRYLYLAGASVGLAFYCKESTALLLPVFALTLLVGKHRQWLLKPQIYLACVTYILVISPDIAWNLRARPETTVTYNDRTVAQATYASHLRRIGGLGLSPYPSMFYLRPTLNRVYLRLTGNELKDETAEYWSVNLAIGVLLLAAVLVTTLRVRNGDQLRIFLLVMFWAIFGFFTVIKRGNVTGRLDPVSWIWVETTLVPAVVVAGARLAEVSVKWRVLTGSAVTAALVWACLRLLLVE